MTLRRFSVSSRPTTSGALRRALPLLVGLVVVLSLAAVSMLLGRANLHGSERQRLEERARLTQSVNGYATKAYAPDKLREDVSRAPFNAKNRVLNELLLQQFQVTPTGDPNLVVALFDRDGKVIAARPANTDLTVGLLGDAWQRALAGQVSNTPTIQLDKQTLRAYAIPVGPGKPWAVLVTVPRDDSGQQFYQRLGGLGGSGGGFSTVDRNGIRLTSWQPETIGTRQFDATDMQAIQAAGFRRWTTGSGSTETVHMAAFDPTTGFTQVFVQRTDDLFSDLRKAQHARDLTVLAVLFVAIAALALLGWRRERTARRSSARLHALLKNAHDLVVVVAPDSTTRFVSPAIEDLLGYDQAAWTGRPLLDLVHPGDAARLRAMLADPCDARALNIRLCASDGTVRWFDVESSDRSAEAHIGGILLTCHEVGERKHLQDQLSFQASHDELTGLANRAVFCERVELRRAAARRQPDDSFAVLFIDLDYFKQVNDTLGHDAGDQVLRTVAARLAVTIRAEDLVCRFGGDEFGVLLSNSDEQTAVEIASRLVRAVRAPIAVNANLVHIDASIGVTLSGGSRSEGSERLIREADEAMYVAKETGRGRFSVYRGQQPLGEPTAAALIPAQPAATDVVSIATTDTGRGANFPRALATSAGRSWRSRIRHLLPLIVAGALVVGIASLGSAQEAKASSEAEAHRVAERSDVTARVADYSAIVTAPTRLMPSVQQAPWNLRDLKANSAVLAAFSHSPAAGPNSVVAITRLDGTVAASYPAGSTVGLPANDRTWILARKGIPAFSSLQDPAGTPRAWYVLPILKNGRPTALLLIGQSSRDAEVSKLMQAVGSLGFGEGGLSTVDSRGLAYVAHDARFIGTQIVRPTDLMGLKRGEVRRIDRDGQVLLVTPAWPPGDPNPRYIVFRQPTDVFFGDLRSGQTSRNLLLVGLVCAAVLGLALLNRRRELAERRSRDRLRALLHHAHDLVVAVDSDGRTTFVSSAIEGLLGYAASDWAARPFLDLVDADDRARLTEALHGRWHEGEGDRVVTDVRLVTVDGSRRWFDVGIADLSGNPAVSGLLLTCHEIGERKRLQDELSHRARHDVLTGLANRASFVRHLAETTDGGSRFAVLFIDLDHFKPVNDRYGHDAGDAVLQAVAGRLESAVRTGSFRPSDLISRLGGDEFAVVLGDIDDVEARRAADRILAAIRRPIRVGSTDVIIGATIGIAFADASDLSDASGLGPDVVVQRADTAMYQAKVEGRGRYAVFGT